MRKPVLLIFSNAAILIVLFSLMTQSLFIVARLASAKSVTGQVQIKRSGDEAFVPVVKGDTVKSGDEIQTGANGHAEFAWADGTRWKLEPNTRLTVQRAAINSWRKTEQTQFHLDAGKVFVRVVKSLAPGSSFQIETPSAVAAVRGTVWSIEVAGDKTRVGVYKGFVEVKGQGNTQTVLPGKEAVAGATGVQLEATTPQSDSAFQAQSDMIVPSLDFNVKTGKVAAVLKGQTEAGDSLGVNGDSITVLGNGSFVKRIPLKSGHNEWKVTATDKHGETASVCRAVEFDSAKGVSTPSECQ